eukprot:jgi/Phyca11/129626/e_gw1.86.146.1
MARAHSSASGDDTFLSTAPTQCSTMVASTLLSATETLKDWVFWQRDASKVHCWTKVYGVLDDEFLWLFDGNHSNRAMVLKIAVSSVMVPAHRQLHVLDPCGEEVKLSPLNKASFDKWRLRLEEAAALTAQFFRMVEIDARQLSRTSAYRGSLRRTKKRVRCKALIMRLVTQWKDQIALGQYGEATEEEDALL